MENKKSEAIATGEQQYLPFQFNSVKDYLRFYGFALRNELINYGFNASEIDKTIENCDICCSYKSPNNLPVLYWLDKPRVLDRLSELGAKKDTLVGKIYSSISGKTELGAEDQDILESFKELSDPIRIVIGN